MSIKNNNITEVVIGTFGPFKEMTLKKMIDTSCCDAHNHTACSAPESHEKYFVYLNKKTRISDVKVLKDGPLTSTKGIKNYYDSYNNEILQYDDKHFFIVNGVRLAGGVTNTLSRNIHETIVAKHHLLRFKNDPKNAFRGPLIVVPNAETGIIKIIRETDTDVYFGLSVFHVNANIHN